MGLITEFADTPGRLELDELEVNQGLRTATFLADIRHVDQPEDWAQSARQLYEYEMPGGSTALVEIRICHTCRGIGWLPKEYRPEHTLYSWEYLPDIESRTCRTCFGSGYWKARNVSYARIPRYWIEALLAHGNENALSFLPQQANSRQISLGEKRYDRLVADIRQDIRLVEKIRAIEAKEDGNGSAN